MTARFLLTGVLLLLPFSALADAANPPAARSPVNAATQMVASANPYATDAGLEILRRGGSAVDAAIAVELVLTLVEPQSSGIGGGAFLLYWDDQAKTLQAYDGRETAPSAVDETLFLDASGGPRGKSDAVPGGQSAGVPGVVRMLAMAHKAHGRLGWAELFQPAIKLARDGFVVSPRFTYLISNDKHLKKFPETAAYFFDAKGEPVQPGTVLKNPALANTLEILAADPEAFYTGPIAADIAAAIQNTPINPGKLTEQDIAGYQPRLREPVCVPYRVWRICGMGPPSSGGIAVGQTLGILEGLGIDKVRPMSAEAVNLFAESARLAYADRATWLGDTDFVHVPVAGLIDPSYIASRRALVTPGSVMPDAPAGLPPGAREAYRTVEPSEIPATTHFSIVDRWGGTVAMTASIEDAFGDRMMVRGFLLNNELTDFSFAPEAGGKPVANRVQGGKRPLSSMSPTIVFDAEGRPVATLGSPGGPLIIGFVAKTLVGVLDWKLNIQDAIALPNLVYFGGNLIMERDSALWQQKDALAAMGYQMREGSLVSGLHGIVIHYDDNGGRTLEGGADPRREGTAAGD
ncbi:gamma-glutamyltransferase [Emcibacter sp. SYSU 3D8]|uniref:gamma-glutamyltransferase n=1 Tax=Emcibacter sp. SYSU 3D8 TaxID=3133969 RepID=UPI0031FF1E88